MIPAVLLRIALFFVVVFILPALLTLAWWGVQEHPASWNSADWSASGILPPPARDRDAAIYLMAARTGGLKGAFSVHSWIVFKKPGATSYLRYDKVGWGMPVRRNAYPADGRWYSNMPEIVHEAHGEEAARLIPRFEAAIADYPYATRGNYRLWPGPNSNSFVAHLLRQVPEFGAVMPPNATGRDFAPGLAALDWSAKGRDLHVTLGGIFGISVGAASGFEMHFLGLVAGFDVARAAIKIPAYGTVRLWRREAERAA